MHRAVKVALHLVAEGFVQPAQVGAVDRAAGPIVGIARNPRANGRDIAFRQAELAQQLPDTRGNIPDDDRKRPPGSRLGLQPFHQPAVLIDRPDLDMRSAQIYPDTDQSTRLLWFIRFYDIFSSC